MPVQCKPYPTLADLTPKQLVSFAAKIDRRGIDECWPWIAGCDGKGYGAFGWNGRVLIASRLSWVIEHGSVPIDRQVLHDCDNPPCCNPAHHYLGDHGQNVRDRTSRQRMTYHRGASNCNAKLTVEQAAECIRRRLAGESSYALSLEFGIAQPSVCAMALGRRYREAYELAVRR